MTLIFFSYCGYLIKQVVDGPWITELSVVKIDGTIPPPTLNVRLQGTILTNATCYIGSNYGINCPINTHNDPYFDYNYANLQDIVLITDDKPYFAYFDPYNIIWEMATRNTSSAFLLPPSLELYMSQCNEVSVPIDGFNDQIAAIDITPINSYVGYSTHIIYHFEATRSAYRDLVSSKLGFGYEYINTVFIVPQVTYVPLNTNRSGLYNGIARNANQGHITFGLASTEMMVKTEVRQHTLLTAIALAGGLYGVLTSIFILFFGMSRIAPFGFIHHVPALITRIKRRKYFNNDHENIILSVEDNQSMAVVPRGEKQSKLPLSSLIPWFFRSPFSRTNNESDVITNNVLKTMISQKYSQQKGLQRDDMEILNESFLYTAVHEETTDIPFSGKYDPMPRGDSLILDMRSSIETMSAKLKAEEDRSAILCQRMNELEIILREYYINIDYINDIRSADLLDTHSRKGTVP